MATSRGKDRARDEGGKASPEAAGSAGEAGGPPGAAPEARIPGIPEIVRRALSLGLSGFFLTEEAVRKALGDTLPRDWTDFAVEQSDRTRREFIERLTYEMARSLDNVDLAAVLRELLEGRTLEIKAEVRLAPDETSGPGKLRVAVREREPDR